MSTDSPSPHGPRPATWIADHLEWPVTSRVGAGLDGAVATTTRVAHHDGTTGEIRYRGEPLDALAREARYEDVVALLLTGKKDGPDAQRVADALTVPQPLPDLLTAPRDWATANPLDGVRLALSGWGSRAPHAWTDPPTALARALTLLERALRSGTGSAHPEDAIGRPVAERILTAAASTHDAPRARVRAVDTVLVTLADVGLAPPTFAALVVASCRADLPSALVAHLAAADGTRSLGAAHTLGEWLDPGVPIGEIQVAVQRAVMEERTIPGFGHRILPATDGRVAILERAVEELRESGDGPAHPPGRVEHLVGAYDTIVTGAARPLAARGIGPNALLPATLLLRLTGVPASAITPILAVACLAGTLARIHEYAGANRIFRPLDRYVPAPSGGSR